MINNIVIIASTSGFIAEMLKEKLKEFDFRVMIANDDLKLIERIKTSYPRYVFLEQCFFNNVTDDYIYRIMRNFHNLHIVIWTASDLAPVAAARFIHAGAESFFSLRDTVVNIEKILNLIVRGKRYYPDDVETALDSDNSLPIFNVHLTKRELQIEKLSDKSDQEILEILSISICTVKFHKSNIFKKSGRRRKSQVLIDAINKGVIDPKEYL